MRRALSKRSVSWWRALALGAVLAFGAGCTEAAGGSDDAGAPRNGIDAAESDGGGAPTGEDGGSERGGEDGGEAGGQDGGPVEDDDAGQGTAGCGSPVTAGETTQTITVNGVERTYLVVVPPSLDGDIPAPVLLGFHGGNGTSEQAYRNYGLVGEEPMLYVFPQAPYWPEAGGVGWDVDPAGVDFPYFDAMLADLAAKYCIDEGRIFAAGQSNGGFFVNALGCYRPDALRAIAPVAGGGPPGSCTVSPMAVMAIHGSADSTVPVSSGAYARDYWLASNGCSGAPRESVDPPPCVAYTGCAEPVLWCEHGGGHPWPAFAGAAIRAFFLSL